MNTTAHRIPWPVWTDRIVPALEKASADASLKPLEGLVPEVALDPSRHLLRGRRYLLFGPEETVLIQVVPLLEEAIRQASLASLSCGDQVAELAEVSLAFEELAPAALRLKEGLRPGHLVPEWVGGGAPAVLSPAQVGRLKADLDTLGASDELAARDRVLAAFARELADFVDPESGLAWIHRA